MPSASSQTRPASPGNARGFVLAELVFLTVIAVIVAATLLIAGDGWRRNGRIGQDFGKLREIYAGTMSYTADSGGVLPTLWWKAGTNQTPYSDLMHSFSDLEAARKQMVHIARTRGGRTPADSPVVANLFPYNNWGHLALCDYLDLAVPSQMFISAGDRHRLLWIKDPKGYDQGLYTPNLGTGGLNWRHPYSASFMANTYWFDRSPVGQRVSPASPWNALSVPPNAVLGGRDVRDITYPSHKVLLHDTMARYHHRPEAFCLRPEARLPFLMGDGAVTLRTASEANPGADPNFGGSVSFSYTPSAIEPPASPIVVTGKFLWTRKALGGRDFGATEP